MHVVPSNMPIIDDTVDIFWFYSLTLGILLRNSYYDVHSHCTCTAPCSACDCSFRPTAFISTSDLRIVYRLQRYRE